MNKTIYILTLLLFGCTSQNWPSKIEVTRWTIPEKYSNRLPSTDDPLSEAPNKKNINIIKASQNKSIKDVKIFYERNKSSVYETDKDGYTALDYSALNVDNEICQFLLQRNAKVNLFIATRIFGLSEVKKVYRKEDLNKKWLYQLTPLQLACLGGKVDIIQFFISEGVDINYKNIHGTALHLAASNLNLEVVKTLVQSGADPEIEGEYGWTPLKRAMEYGENPVTEYLKSIIKTRRTRK